MYPDLKAGYKFTVYFADDPRSFEHKMFDEAYGASLMSILKLCSYPSFTSIDCHMVVIHESACHFKTKKRGNFVPKYLRLLNARLLVYSTPDAKYPVEAMFVK